MVAQIAPRRVDVENPYAVSKTRRRDEQEQPKAGVPAAQVQPVDPIRSTGGRAAVGRIDELQRDLQSALRLPPKDALEVLRGMEGKFEGAKAAVDAALLQSGSAPQQEKAVHDTRKAVRTELDEGRKDVQKMIGELDPLHRGTLVLLNQAQAVERALHDHSSRVEERTRDLNLLNDLRRRLQEVADEEKFEFDESWHKMMETARRHGVVWEKSGWESRKELSALTQGVDCAISSVTSTNKIDQLRYTRLIAEDQFMMTLASALQKRLDETKRRINDHMAR